MFDFSTKIIMEEIVKNPGLQLIIQNILSCLNKNSIASFRLVNQDCKNIVDNPIVYLKKVSQVEAVPKDLIGKWRKLCNAIDTKYTLALELFKMYSTNNAKWPLEVAYDIGESKDKSNTDLAMAILENSVHESFVKAKEPQQEISDQFI